MELLLIPYVQAAISNLPHPYLWSTTVLLGTSVTPTLLSGYVLLAVTGLLLTNCITLYLLNAMLNTCVVCCIAWSLTKLPARLILPMCSQPFATFAGHFISHCMLGIALFGYFFPLSFGSGVVLFVGLCSLIYISAQCLWCVCAVSSYLLVTAC